jgi:hypothetical protein
MDMVLPHEVMNDLARASWHTRHASAGFVCRVFDSQWDRFVEQWAPVAHNLILNALGPFGEEPNKVILPLEDGAHLAGVNASYMPGTGQIRLSRECHNDPGKSLEKLTHEMTHANLVGFPEGDPFYEEGFVDYAVWILSHAPCWGKFQSAVQKSAEDNIRTRLIRARLDQSDFDRKRWAGGVFASVVRGPWLLSILRSKKAEGNMTW